MIDPVDKSRNAAAALSKEKLLLLRKLAKQYLNKPSQKYFQKQEWYRAEHKNVNQFLTEIELYNIELIKSKSW